MRKNCLIQNSVRDRSRQVVVMSKITMKISIICKKFKSMIRKNIMQQNIDLALSTSLISISMEKKKTFNFIDVALA